MKIVVVKIGGSSLFSTQPLSKLIEKIGESLPDQAILLIVGGGELVESMRLIHAQRPELNCQKMHWRCIQLLETTLEIACELTPHIPVVRSWGSLKSAVNTFQQLPTNRVNRNQSPPIAWVSIAAFYNADTEFPEGFDPSQNWDTTSDTLAWLLALRTKLPEIVLLKHKNSSIKSSRVSQGPEQLLVCSDAQALTVLASNGVIDSELARLSALTPSIQVKVLFVESN